MEILFLLMCNFSELFSYKDMDKNKEIKIAIVGMGLAGISTHVARFLAEKEISIDDVIVLNQEDIKDINKLEEIVKNAPSGKFILFNDVNFILAQDSLPKVFKYENPRKGLEPTIEQPSLNCYNKKNFGGHKPSKNQKLRRR